jgi:hypothetical protein
MIDCAARQACDSVDSPEVEEEEERNDVDVGAVLLTTWTTLLLTMDDESRAAMSSDGAAWLGSVATRGQHLLCAHH